MSSIRTRKRGKFYEYCFDVGKIKNRRKRITKSGFKTKAEAQEAGTVAYEEYIRTGIVIKECQMSYYDYLDFWYENYCKVNLKYTTQEAYKNIIEKYLKPTLGLYRISAITSVTLHSFLTELCSKYTFSRSYFKNILKVMKGTEIIKKLSKELKEEYGKGFDSRNLYYFLNFYKTFPNILNTVCSKSDALLSWSHYRTLLQVLDKEAREWYEKEALGQTWSVRTLQRNISSQYYYRLLKSQVKEPVVEEMKKVNENQYLMNKLEFVKNPVIAEFLGYSLDSEFTETELETSIINNLQKFLMELRKRICFCCKTTTHSY